MRKNQAPFDYTYLGPCGCGFGSNAFYIARDGTIMHAAQIFFPAALREPGERELLVNEAGRRTNAD